MPFVSRRVLRRASIYGALLAILGLASLSLTQCTMVDDNLTGVSLSESFHKKTDKCLKDCSKDYEKALKAEFRDYQKARKKCRRHAEAGDAIVTGEQHGDDLVCLALAKEEHRKRLEAIEEEYKKCRGDCHHQGGGGSR